MFKILTTSYHLKTIGIPIVQGKKMWKTSTSTILSLKNYYRPIALIGSSEFATKVGTYLNDTTNKRFVQNSFFFSI